MEKILKKNLPGLATISKRPSGEYPNTYSRFSSLPAPTILIFPKSRKSIKSLKNNKKTLRAGRRRIVEWSRSALQQPIRVRWLSRPIRILPTQIPFQEKPSDWLRALNPPRTLEMHVQGHVTYSERESHRHFQTIDTRTPLIGSKTKTKPKSVKIHYF